MMVEEIDGKRIVEAACHKKNRKLEDLRGRLVDQAKKQVGDQVTICHKLLTIMFVTLDGVQMPSKAVT
jgi:hypothetical protein